MYVIFNGVLKCFFFKELGEVVPSFAKRTKLPGIPPTPATALETPQSPCALISLHELLKSMSKAVSKAGEEAVQDREDEEIEKQAHQ